MKNDSTSFFENNHFANSYVYDISISHVPAYFGLHWHHYIEIVLAQDDGIIYEVNGETFPLKPGDLLFIWPGELHAVSTTNREHRLIMLQLDADFLEKRVDFQSVAYLFYQIRLLNQNNFPEIEKLRGFLTELRRLSLSGISFSELRGCVLLYQFFILLGENLSVPTETAAIVRPSTVRRWREEVISCPRRGSRGWTRRRRRFRWTWLLRRAAGPRWPRCRRPRQSCSARTERRCREHRGGGSRR